jgi:hypothetical protein
MPTSSALKMETVCFFEMLAPTYESTRRQNSEEQHYHPHPRENLKSEYTALFIDQRIRDNRRININESASKINISRVKMGCKSELRHAIIAYCDGIRKTVCRWIKCIKSRLHKKGIPYLLFDYFIKIYNKTAFNLYDLEFSRRLCIIKSSRATISILETLDFSPFNHLTRLVAQEDFIIL